MRQSAIYMLLSIAVIICGSCSVKHSHAENEAVQHSMPDTLRVATLYSPTSYFLYRDTVMGYDYSLVTSLAKDKGLTLELKVAASLTDAIEMLDSGLVDMISYDVPVTSEYNERVIHCGPRSTTSQVLVQPRNGKEPMIHDVTQLVGRDVYVEVGSKYQQRINNLNDELGGGINIHTVDRDTLITEDLIKMVQDGEIPLTVVDSDIARINKTYYPDLDITMEISFPQRSAWAVRNSDQWLADSIDAWFNSETHRQENAMLLKQYFEQSKNPVQAHANGLKIRNGVVSPYDNLFRSYGKSSGIDWRLLAAIGYVESGFDNNAVSWAGARGIMQIMPSVARLYGSTPAALADPSVSVQMAARIFKDLDKSLSKKIENPRERIKFILASYNAGLGHIYDAIEIARATNHDPVIWYGNVEHALTLKSNPLYYNQPYCRNGYFRSAETVAFVHKVMDMYDKISSKTK